MAGLILLSSLLALVYVWRVVEVAYFQPIPEGAPEVREAPLGLLGPIWILTAAILWFGVFTTDTAGVAEKAAARLLGAAP